MAQEIADSKLIDTWSSSGLAVKPDISKIIEGWQLGEQPPHEYMNWLQNTFGSKLNHILKNGVAKWNDETEYLAGSSVQHSGSVWKCKTTNTNSEPTELNNNWKEIPSLENLALTVDTINDFPSGATTDDVVIVKDLDRGGIFIYDSTKVAEHNNGTNFNGWIRQYSGAVNVKWFGAIGDGVTDDTNTLNSIKLTEDIVNFEDGIYKTSRIGDIGALSVLTADERNATFKRTGNDTFISAADRDNLYIENITIDNQKSINGFEGHGISTYGDNQTFKNVKVLDYGSDGTGGGAGLLLSGTHNKNARVTGCHFEAEKDTSSINIGWLASDYTTSFFDSIYSKDIINGIGYAHELKNNSTHNILSNLISENSKVLVAYGQETAGIDGADYNIASNILGKSTQNGYIVGEGHHNLLNGMILDNNNNPIAPGVNSGIGVAYAGGASKNVSTGVLTSGTLEYEILYDDNSSYNYTEIATYADSDYLVRLNAGASNNVTNIVHAGQRTSIRDILDNSGNGLGVGGNVVYSNGYGQYIGSLSGSWLWQISDSNPSYLNSNHWRFTDKNYTYLALGSDGTSGNVYGINFATPATGNRGSFSFILGANAVNDFFSMRINGTSRYSFQNSFFKPDIDNEVSLGASGFRWSTVYAATGTINTSDAREKTFSSIPEVEKQVAIELKGLMRRFKFNDAIEKKGEDKARIHYGTSAQEVIAVFEKYGLNAMDYAMVCYDEWEEQEEVKDEDGNITQEYRPSGNKYGIRYEELLCFIISAM